MIVSQQRIFPRCKEWKPLSTQQYRLRNVIQIIGINIGKTDLEGKSCGSRENQSDHEISYYYTLHMTAMSAPFYTSEKIQSDCPKWKEINASTNFDQNVFCNIAGFILRLWCHDNQLNCDEVILIWAVHLTGLTKFATYLSFANLPKTPNTIIFLMPGGYYINPSIINELHISRYSSITVDKNDIRPSYAISNITKLNSAQKLIMQKTDETSVIKQKVINGDYLSPDNKTSATLRRLLNKNKPKCNHLDVAKLKDSVDVAKFRLKLLNDEKQRIIARLSMNRNRLDNLIDRNQMKESNTMEKYRLLQREVQAYREWLLGHYQRREAQLHAKTLLNFRIQQLISELQYIYPVTNEGNRHRICGVHLPDSENLTNCDDLQISVGLGFVAHAVQMISIFLQVPLRYPIIHVGSRSCIVDLIIDKVPDDEREFPLYCKGKDKLQFNYAVYLLNKDIAALRWLCGLPTQDLRSTLPNLSSILHLRGADLPTESLSRSPVLSTIDMTSSSFSVSSPVTASLHTRSARKYRLSESTVDYSTENIAAAEQASSFFYLEPNFNASSILQKTESQSLSVNDEQINSNFSYSLDKGLNKLEELKRKSQWMEKPTYSSSAQSGTRGSESNLHDSTSRCPKRDIRDVGVTKFLQNWDVDKNYVIFSDEDSDTNNSCQFMDKTVSCIEDKNNFIEIATERDEKGICFGVDAGNSSYYSCSPEKGHSSEKCDTLLGVEAVDNYCNNELSINVLCQPAEEGACSSASATNVEDIEISGEDALLDNVTDRTEALANQATSFNMFRARFRSTLGGTN